MDTNLTIVLMFVMLLTFIYLMTRALRPAHDTSKQPIPEPSATPPEPDPLWQTYHYEHYTTEEPVAKSALLRKALSKLGEKLPVDHEQELVVTIEARIDVQKVFDIGSSIIGEALRSLREHGSANVVKVELIAIEPDEEDPAD